jgi:hypothetical protein
VGTQELVGSSVLCEASYGISYSERGASVAFVASEPITGSTTDWVSPVLFSAVPSQKHPKITDLWVSELHFKGIKFKVCWAKPVCWK